MQFLKFWLILIMQRMMHWKAINTLILAISLVEIIKGSAVSVPSNIEAQMRVLYSSTNISVISQVFSFSFSHSNFVTMPSFGHGISDFRLNRNLNNVNLNTQAVNLTQTSVRIQLSIDNTTSTPIIKLCISYIAIWNHAGIFVVGKTYSNMTNVTTSSNYGDRYYQIYQVYSFASGEVTGVPFLKGFYETSNVASQVSVSVTVVSSANYQVRVSTTADCLVKSIFFDILFFYTDSVTNAAYVYAGDAYSFSSGSANAQNYTQTLTNYSTTVVVLGLRGFNAFNFYSDIEMGWTLLNVSADVATFLMYKNNLQWTVYSYFQIGSIAASPSTGGPSAESSSYIGIIVGLIAGVAAISVGIVVIVKCYFKSIVYTMPEKNDFRALPALTF